MGFEKITFTIEPSFSGGLHARFYSNNRGKSYLVEMYRTGFPLFCKDSFGNLDTSDLEKRVVNVTYDDAERFLRACRDVTISAVPDFASGLDGTTYTLTLECGFNCATYKWWSYLPNAWQGLQVIVEMITHWFASTGWAEEER